MNRTNYTLQELTEQYWRCQYLLREVSPRDERHQAALQSLLLVVMAAPQESQLKAMAMAKYRQHRVRGLGGLRHIGEFLPGGGWPTPGGVA